LEQENVAAANQKIEEMEAFVASQEELRAKTEGELKVKSAQVNVTTCEVDPLLV
jgi:hypothetical protein